MHRRIWAPAIIFVSIFAAGCEEEPTPIIRERCQDDSDCLDAEVCEVGECVPRDAVSCQVIEGGQPILQPGPPRVDFGQVGPATTERVLTLRNIGDCTLTLFEAFFEKEDGSPFTCPRCTPDQFPIEMFPFRDIEIGVFFTPEPGDVGDFADTLVLLSDDTEYQEIRVPIRARFRGVPDVKAIPEIVDFGFVPVGRTVQKQIQISNQGSGTASLMINSIEVEPTGTTAFSYAPELMEPIELDPISVDQTDTHTVVVQYHPKELGIHEGELVVQTDQLSNGTIRIPILGTSKTPPKINTAPERIEFGVVPLGQTAAQVLTIINEGGSPLKVSYTWGGTGLSTDLSALPVTVPDIEPGQFTELQVFVTATAPAPITGLLILESNDPNRPTITIPVSAEGQDIIGGTQVVKIDMNFENGDDSFFGEDVRNVDMALENPFGLICDKANANPPNWGAFGSPSWIAFGVKEEPERIVLPDAQQDGTYRVILTYIEDCESVPTQLVASILGISVDILIGALLGGGVGVDPSSIADVIASLCLDHSGSAATITVFVNGQVIAEEPASVNRKGDFVYALDLVRQNGQFSVQ